MNTFFLILTIVDVAFGIQSCTVSDKYNNSRIFTAASEVFPNYLDNFISGVNISFTNVTALPPGHTIYNSIQEVYNSTRMKLDNEFVAVTSFEALDGSVSIAILSIDDEDGGGYDLDIGESLPGQVIPFMEFQMSLDFFKNQYQCYSLVHIDQSTVVVGCINITEDGEGEVNSQTVLILVDAQQEITKIFSFDNWENFLFLPSNMKIQYYDPFLITDDEQINYNTHYFDQKFLLISYLYEGYESNQQTSIDIFRIAISDNDVSNAQIIQHAPIDFSSFSDVLSYDTLSVADFEAYDDHIFILEETKGLYQFWLWGDDVDDFDLYYLEFGQQYLALEVIQINEEYDLSILTESKLINYRIQVLQDSIIADKSCVKQFEVTLEGFTLEDHVPLISNEEYISLQIGSMLFIHDRRSGGQLWGTVKDVGSFVLLFSDDLLIFNENLIDHRIVQRPLLLVSSETGATNQNTDQQEYVIELLAISRVFQDSVTCYVQFNSTIITSQDFKGIENANIKFSSSFFGSSDYYSYFPLDLAYIGPNIQYDIESFNDGGKLQSDIFAFRDVPRNVSSIGIEPDDWSLVTVAKVAHKDDDSFYALFQFKNNTVKIFACEVVDNLTTSVQCSNPCHLSLDGNIDMWDVGKMDNNDNNLVWSYVSSDDVIFFYDFKCVQRGTITRYRTYYEIIDIEIQDDLLFIIFDSINSQPVNGSAMIDVRTFDNSFRRQFQITYDNVAEFPQMSKSRWVPKKILLSDNYDGILFIELDTADMTSNSLLAVYVDDRYADYLFHYVFSEQVSVFVAGESFFVYKLKSETIEEYSLRNIDKPQFLKVLPLYNYNILHNKVMASGSDLLYVLAVQNDQEQNAQCKTTALIYHPHHALIDELYSTLPIDCSQNILELIVHVDGTERDTMIVVNQGQLSFFRVPQTPQIGVTSNLEENVYIENFTFWLSIIPWDNQTYPTQKLDYWISLLNQQLKVRLKQDRFIELGYNNLTLPSDNQAEITYSLNDTELHMGTVFRYNLECIDMQADCLNQNIVLTNVAEVDNYDAGFITEARDILYDDRDTHRIYVLNENFIFILDQDLLLVEPPVHLGIDPSVYQCSEMAAQYSDEGELDIIYAMCQNVQEMYESFLPVSFMTVEPFAGFPITMKQVTQIDQVQIDEDYLFVNDLEDKAKGIGIIYIFQIDLSQEDAYTYDVLDKNFFRVKGDFEIMSFEILPTEDGNQDKLLVAEKYMRLYAFNYERNLSPMRSGKAVGDHDVWSANLQDELTNDELYFTNSTYLQKTFTFLYEVSQDDFNIYTAAVHLSDTAIYYIKFSFDENKPQDDTIYMDVLGVFNNYGSYQSQITLRGNSNSGLFAEVYKHPEKNQILFGIYDTADIPASSSQKFVGTTYLPVLPIKAGIIYEDIFDFDLVDNYEFFQDNQQQWHVAVIDQLNQTIQGIKYSKQVKIQIKAGTQEQRILLQAQSDYAASNDIFNINLYSQQKPPVPPSHEKSFPGWAIALIVIGSLGLIGSAGVGWYIYKKKKKQGTIDQSQQRAYQRLDEEKGQSLQAQTKE